MNSTPEQNGENKTVDRKRLKMPEQEQHYLIFDCKCGSKIQRRALHEATRKHKAYIENGTIFKAKTAVERSRGTFLRLRETIYKCECGKNVRKSSKYKHEKTTEHQHFIKNGCRKITGNIMKECICGAEILCYNMAKHLATERHRNYIENEQRRNEIDTPANEINNTLTPLIATN
jgi:hypothetical protein